MEILFIVDNADDINKKISLFENLSDNIKFFVDAKLVGKVARNKQVSKNTIAIYNGNLNATIDNYIKSKDYTPTPTLLYCSSAQLSSNMVEEIRNNLMLKPHVIYAKKKF